MPANPEDYNIGSNDKPWLRGVWQGRDVDFLGKLTIGGKIPDDYPYQGIRGLGLPFIDFYNESPIGTKLARFVMLNAGGQLYWTAISADETIIKDIMVFDIASYPDDFFGVFSHFFPMTENLNLGDSTGGAFRWQDLALSRYAFLGKVDSLPTASADYRGVIVTVEGGAGVTDRLYVCMKSAANTYSWVQIASG